MNHFFTLILTLLSLMTYGQPTVDLVIKSLENKVSHTNMENSFSPLYSDIGLGFDEKNAGISKLYLHYNRRTLKIGHPFLKIDNKLISNQNKVLSVNQTTAENGKLSYVFYDHNSWITEAENIKEIAFELIDTAYTEVRVKKDPTTNSLFFEGFYKNLDIRDPDKKFPVLYGIRMLSGQFNMDDNNKILFKPGKDGKMRIAFSVKMLDVNQNEMLGKLKIAPPTFQAAYSKSYDWLNHIIGDLKFNKASDKEVKVLSLAVYTLAFNLKMAPGNMEGFISQFPSRGGYPVHYLWDTCFQNLAYDFMDPQLSKDGIWLLLKNMRPDGKIPQFIASTWIRPHASQPALVGWAAIRYLKMHKDVAFAKQILPYLIKNTNWWLTQRMTKYGVITCADPLETGWDNTPRLDQGEILALDMNTYLLLQMNACREIADMIGDQSISNEMEALSKSYAQKMFDIFYDKDDNLFYEVEVKTGKKMKMISPANFTPLLTDMPISKKDAQAMIKRYLLDPKKLYSAYPFPSVAYDHPQFTADKLWRGPIWISPAYLMLEVLKNNKLEQEHQEASTKLYNMLVNDGKIHEHFNSLTGQGMGREQQGWTAAVLIKLHKELSSK